MKLFVHIHMLTVLTLVFSILSGYSHHLQAKSVLQVLPTRVVLDQKKRWMTVTLVNHGEEEGSYRLFMRNIRTADDGTFNEIKADDPILEGERFADKMIRFSPRRVTVPPKSKQQVRIVVRKPKDLADGEYRSHLVFRALPSQELISVGAEQPALTISSVVEVTIPVIVRHGVVTAEMALTEVELINHEKYGQQVKLTVTRDGNRSLYGDIDIWWTEHNEKKEKRITFIKGIAVYVPNRKRTIIVNLEDKILRSGKLRVVFTEDSAYGGELVAEIEKLI